jgi:hypothetical protein
VGFLGGLLGGGSGSNFKATGAPAIQGANAGQANTAYDQTQQGLLQQQAFAQALQAQNGIGNQSSVFNQLQGVANGTGPNPAQAQLAQATGANVANQASLMAGQRGASANPGMIARQAAQQGAATQQQAAGQGATLQAQQSLAAMNQLGGIAGQQVGQQQAANMGYNQAAQGQQSNILGAINAQNANATAMQSNMNNANAGVAVENAKQQGGLLGGALGGIGTAALGALTGGASTALGAIGSAAGGGMGNSSSTSQFGGLGGNLSFMAQGGQVPPMVSGGPKSRVGAHLKGESIPMQAPMLAQGGAVPAMVSPGEMYLPPKAAAKVAAGKESPKAEGQVIPGKAKVSGDSTENDTVAKTLEAGGCVIPRTHMKDEKTAIAFVRAHMSKAAALKGNK